MADFVEFSKLDDRNISNSEVTAWLSCRRMYEFAFVQNLAPKATSVPLARGTLGHEAFSVYILARLDGSSHDMAMRATNETFTEAMRNLTMDVVMETKFLFTRYMDYHQGWPDWELLGTEERIDLRLTDDFTIPIRYDLLVREKTTGKIKVGDWKFTYDFWQPHEHDLNVQMPKYITVMRANGMQVDGGFLEEIRTRPLGKEKSSDQRNLWRRTNYHPTLERSRESMRQHISASFEIMEYRSKNEDDRRAAAIPVLNKHGACKFCNFTDLCNSMLDGKTDLSVDIMSGYTENTYGYNKNITEGELI